MRWQLLTRILQEGDDFGEGFVHRLQSFLLAARSAADPDALRGACSDSHQLRGERLVCERVDDRKLHVARRAPVSVRGRRLAVSQSQYPEEVDWLRAVDAQKDVVAGVSGLRVRT